MKFLLAGLCVVVIFSVLLEGFEGIVLPRRISRPLRLTRLFYIGLWKLWRAMAPLVPRRARDDYFAVFGPLSVLLMFITWANALIVAFALLWASLSVPLGLPAGEQVSLGDYFYLSATTFITLGFGDVAPKGGVARTLADIEAGVGFGFLAIVIGYLPVLYSAFSRREVEIGLLDARASTPPSAGELLRRVGDEPDQGDMKRLLERWEQWSAELLESHLSYAALLYWRSQHDRQSWLATLTTILDTSALLLAAVPSAPQQQARLTFAMARHAVVDLRLGPPLDGFERLTPAEEDALFVQLRAARLRIDDSPEARGNWRELRALYEPHVAALAQWLALSLPTLPSDPTARDCWRTSSDPEDHFFHLSRGR